MAVITPPVGLILYVIDAIAPDLSIGQIIRRALPFVGIEPLCIQILITFNADLIDQYSRQKSGPADHRFSARVH
ncbi:MAG: TRAP transporter large permease subunit [Yoonia sp.]|uniref:TRAP transporter large permease subunit n=1 Tax=Yoonia sp. TaxID=2212373 RepID=UPI003EF4E8B3